MAGRFDYALRFVRESDRRSGYVIYRNEKARIVIVRFPSVDWEAPYNMDGTPVWLHHGEHRLVNVSG